MARQTKAPSVGRVKKVKKKGKAKKHKNKHEK